MAGPQPQVDVGGYYGKYFLLKKLAAGGMGEIFLAKQQGPAGFEKILVVKKVLAHLTENKEFVELFLAEARLAARMNHRNIVQVFELGGHQGSYFIAMEYVAGRTLRELIDANARRKEKLPGEMGIPVRRYQLAAFIRGARQVMTDRIAMKKGLEQVYAYARGPARTYLDDYYRANNPFEIAKTTSRCRR